MFKRPHHDINLFIVLSLIGLYVLDHVCSKSDVNSITITIVRNRVHDAIS